jgi:hypothetical protein
VQIATRSTLASLRASNTAGDSEFLDLYLPSIATHVALSLFWNIQTHEILAACNRSLPRNISLTSCDTKLPNEAPASARDISNRL